jgi:hypothetical protein
MHSLDLSKCPAYYFDSSCRMEPSVETSCSTGSITISSKTSKHARMNDDLVLHTGPMLDLQQFDSRLLVEGIPFWPINELVEFCPLQDI